MSQAKPSNRDEPSSGLASDEGSRPAAELGFDERLGRLESIIATLEEGGLGLEPAIEHYQEGIEHLKLCHRSLESYRRRVEELTKDAEGALKPFASDPDAE